MNVSLALAEVADAPEICLNYALSPEELFVLDTETGLHRFFTNGTEFDNFVATQDYS